MERSWTNHSIKIDGFKTHYLEAGTENEKSIVLIHSGEFGASAELSWEYNIEALAEEFHVLAPELWGYGKSAKIFDFENKFEYRVNQIEEFVETLCIESAHFMGNSMGGTMLARVACRSSPPWPLDKIVLVAGGGEPLDNRAREVLKSYDGTEEHMEKMMDVLFYTNWWNDDYIKRRVEESKRTGAFQCTTAPRIRAPFESGESRFSDYPFPYDQISVPTLIVAGEKDKLRKENYAHKLNDEIPNSQVLEFSKTGHLPHIERSDEFNPKVISFLKG